MKQHYVNVNDHKHGCIWYIYMLPIHLTLLGMELGRNPFLFCIWALSLEIIKFQPLIYGLKMSTCVLELPNYDKIVTTCVVNAEQCATPETFFREKASPH